MLKHHLLWRIQILHLGTIIPGGFRYAAARAAKRKTGSDPMQYRSWLLVPGDSDRKLGKAMATGADIVVVDLADTVAISAKCDARRMAIEWLNAWRRQIIESRRLGRWVRINAMESGQWREDLMAVVPAAPDGIILPNVSGTEPVLQLAAELYELEQANQLPSGSIRIMPVIGTMAHAAFSVAAFADLSLPRISALAWDAERLASAIGATRTYDARLGWTGALALVRAQVLLAAHASGLFAVETCCGPANDQQMLNGTITDARADGFSGMIGFHPAQVAEINKAFSPTAEELENARRIVALFEASPYLSEIQLDRRIVGPQQLLHAKRLLQIDTAKEQVPAARMPILRTA